MSRWTTRWAVLSVVFPVDTSNLWANGFHAGHLVIDESSLPVGPRELLCHGSGGDSIFAAGSTRIDGTPAHWYRVLCPESIFLGHLAVVWSRAGHSYAVGFHDWTKESRVYGLQVAKSVVLVGAA